MTGTTRVASASLVLALLAGGCRDHTAATPVSPTTAQSPQPASGPTPAPAQFLSLHLIGQVHEWDGSPVGQALVKVKDGQRSTTLITDGTGTFETTAALDLRYSPLIAWISIRREGYEDLENGAVFANRQDTTVDFVMFRTTVMTAGSTALVPFAYNGPLCGFDEEYPCRHLTITAPTAGSLVMETFGDATNSFFIGPIEYPFVGLTRKTFRVNAGDTVPVELLWGRSAPRPMASTSEGRLVTRIDP